MESRHEKEVFCMSILLKNCKLMGQEPVHILIEADQIAYIGTDQPSATEVIDVAHRVVLPGLIDPHVHVRDMGLSYKEDWLTASRAAVSGGVTTLLDMPNTQPRTVDAAGLAAKREAAQKSRVNWGLHFGATETNLSDIETAHNIAGIKVFMAESSSDFCVQDPDALRAIFHLAHQLDKPVLVHSEVQACVEAHEAQFEPSILNHNHIRHPKCAVEATRIILKLAEEMKNRLYIVHTSVAEEFEMIQAAKDRGVRVTCEITPHHLLLDTSILAQVGNWGKVNPPIRDRSDQQATLRALQQGVADTFGTDHAPHGLDEKSREYAQAPSGFPGLETLLPLLLTEVHRGTLDLTQLARMTSGNVARALGIANRGEIKVGNYADIIAVDFDYRWTIDPDQFETKAKYSPFAGREVIGKNWLTVVNGQVAYHKGQFFAGHGREIDYR